MSAQPQANTQLDLLSYAPPRTETPIVTLKKDDLIRFLGNRLRGPDTGRLSRDPFEFKGEYRIEYMSDRNKGIYGAALAEVEPLGRPSRQRKSIGRKKTT